MARRFLTAAVLALGLATLASLARAVDPPAQKPAPASKTAKLTRPLDVVTEFDRMVMAHQAKKALDRFVSPDLIEHDPTVKGGSRAGLYKYMVDSGWDESGNREMADIIDRTIASGEWVVVHHHILANAKDKGTVFADIFRVVNGLIVEHWDVMQKVPDTTNDNHYSMW